MAIEYKPVSLADQVFEKLEYSILTGDYKTGEVLSENRLAEELGVSRTPIREAMNRLVYEKLVSETPNGNVVRGISLSDVEDIFEVRKRLEVLATKRAADNMADEQRVALSDVVEQQEYYASKGDVQKVRDLDTEFHELIYSGCGSVTLQCILEPIHHKLMKFRKASLEHEGRILESVAEHRAILEAIKSGNKKEIDALMLKHIEQARKNVVEAM
ncbi:MAG: GntR family transcriptional regulator [Firmicutes bacterium]|nr:GntR family transcriptional regulator [Bacillota bacterium]